MRNDKKVVGIYNQEIFIADLNADGSLRRGIDGHPIFCVLRAVSTDDLESYRDEDEIREYARELWQGAVAAGNYDGSLSDYAEEIIAECNMEDDEEAYPWKDDSWCYVLEDDDVRERADAFLEENDGIEVGTWEASGFYAPDKNFKGFEYVFDEEIAKEYEKERGL